VDGKGALQVKDAAGLEQALAELLTQPEKAADMGRCALQVVKQNQGAIERTVDMIVNHLAKGTETHIA
jgi:3-deoxy-D-manno-octulosonic-acid transferase